MSADRQEQLIAYVVAEDGASVSTEQLQVWLRERLPDYMAPRAIVKLPSLPRSPNGKVDRNVLTSPVELTPEESHHDRSNVSDNGRVAFVAPHSEAEKMVAKIWSDVLGAQSIGIYDRFFQLGGDSLSSMRVLARLGDAGAMLAPRHFMANPSVAEIATLLDRQDSDALSDEPRANASEGALGAAPTSIEDQLPTPMQTTGTNPPLFLVPPEGWRVIVFRELAQHLAPDQPCYSLRLWDADAAPTADCRELASVLIKQMRRIRPLGPYYLLGACEGVYVAWEMACTLQDAGETVGFLGIVNTPNPEQLEIKPLSGQIRDRIRRLKPLSPTQKTMNLSVRFVKWLRRWTRRQLQRRTARIYDRSSPVWRYRPRPLAGRATVFTSADAVQAEDFVTSETFGWGPYAEQGVDLRPVHGKHIEILRPPYVKGFSHILRECLQDAFRRHEKVNGGEAKQ